MTDTRKNVYTSGEVAKICNVASRTVAGWIDSGRLRGYRIPPAGNNGQAKRHGGDRRVTRESLIEFLKAHGIPLGALDDGRKFIAEVMQVVLVCLEITVEKNLTTLIKEAGDIGVNCGATEFDVGVLCDMFHPNVLVIDLAIGRTNALSLVANLQRWSMLQATKTIALACEDDPLPDTLVTQGFDAVLKKPFDTALLAVMVEKLAGAGHE